MSRFRRSAFGTTFFFTIISHRRRPILCDASIRLALRNAIQTVRAQRPFTINAWVLLPDHLHCVWTLPTDDVNYSTRWSLIKHQVSHQCRALYEDTAVTSSRRKHGDAAIWQRRFWEHTIRSDIDMERHVDYIHFNPVKHGYAAHASQWPYSTFGRYVREGTYPEDWGGAEYLRNLDYE
jgi:putative transposase